ncbi:transporter substrate-binding domain-containing protein [Xylophilus sp. GW821-FHT01B05]
MRTEARRWVLGALVMAAAIAAIAAVPSSAWQAPSLASLPLGPALAQARARGSLVVGVRAYPRPAPPGAPTPAEPDPLDAALARDLAEALGLPVRLLPVDAGSEDEVLRSGGIDLLAAGARDAAPTAPPPGVAQPAGSYGAGDGRLIALRRGAVQTGLDLRGRAVCVARGSGYAGALRHGYGARVQPYPSAVHAVSAFMAGECAALAEDTDVLARLQQQPEWRFYALLPEPPLQAQPASIRLAAGDAASRDWLAAALRQWRADGTLARAQAARVGNLSLEVTMLKDGLICH